MATAGVLLSPVSRDVIKNFKSAHAAILKERERLTQRLHEIEQALRQIRALPSGSRNLPPRAANAMNIREAVEKATAKKPLSIREIVEAVQEVGYKFSSSNPVNSVGAFLYGAGKQHFKRVNGKFSPKK
jgi:signal recognition particle subunit SEC65